MPERTRPLFSAPIGELVLQIGREIIAARANLEAYSFSLEKQLEQFGDKVDPRLSVPWQHIPEIEVDMPVALHYFGQRPDDGKTGFRDLHAAPINPTFTNFFNYKGEVAAKIKMTVRSINTP